MGRITVNNLGKAYKQYDSRWARLFEWLDPRTKRYHHLHWVLQDVSFTVEPGETMGIMGVNGAGKSTLLKMITGTIQPTAGSVNITGRVAALLELGMGFHPDFTGRQNVYMAGQLLGHSVDGISELIPEIERFAEIGDYFDQPVRVYSSGMQVRLAFSVATAVRPDVLIVDEALSVGDAYFQAKCYKRINDFKDKGTTLLLVSHSPGDVVKHCERAILLKNGIVELDGSSRDVSNRYMDELFGKRSVKATGAAREDSIVKDQYLDLLRDDTDSFHTRPGYRKEEYRWGIGGASILDYLVTVDGQPYPAQIDGNARADFYFKVCFDTDFDSVVAGFLIKTLEGIFLYGTNSYFASVGREVMSAHTGEVKLFKFSLPMDLNEGHYLISFGISSGDPRSELTPLDRRYDSILVHVGRTVPLWGILDLKAAFLCIEPSSEVTEE